MTANEMKTTIKDERYWIAIFFFIVGFLAGFLYSDFMDSGVFEIF